MCALALTISFLFLRLWRRMTLKMYPPHRPQLVVRNWICRKSGSTANQRRTATVDRRCVQKLSESPCREYSIRAESAVKPWNREPCSGLLVLLSIKNMKYFRTHGIGTLSFMLPHRECDVIDWNRTTDVMRPEIHSGSLPSAHIRAASEVVKWEQKSDQYFYLVIIS